MGRLRPSEWGSRLPVDSSGRKQAGPAGAPRPPVLGGGSLDTVPPHSSRWAPSLRMEKSLESSALEESLGQYQRSLRGELPRTPRFTRKGTRAWWAGAGQVPDLTPQRAPTPARTRRKKMGVAVIFEGGRKFAFPINQWRFP